MGTLSSVGDVDAVRAQSQPMILDPLSGHDEKARRISDPTVRETLKERALLDGAFFISDEGVAEIIPELWILNRHSSHIEAPVLTRSNDQVTVLSRAE